MNDIKKSYLIQLLIFVLGAWVILYKIDVVPMYLWDESRQANNALEMMLSGNYLFPTYNGLPDFWNTKPHLLIVIQAIVFKILGPGLLALRLPSAIAGILTIMVGFRFFQKRNKIHAGFIFVIVLLFSGGFNIYHITRTGDYDSLLILFNVLAITKYYKILFEEHSPIDITSFWIFLLLAALTKGLAMMFWMPPFLLLFLLFRNHNGLTINGILRGVWIPIAGTIMYYEFHEVLTPGYLQAVWNNEITGRYFAPNEGHVTEWYYYAEQIYQSYFKGFWILFVLGIIPIILMKEWRKKIGFWYVFTFLFLIILSTSSTRIHWYMAPAIPAMAFGIGMAFSAVFDKLDVIKYKRIALVFVYTIMGIFSFLNWGTIWKNNLTYEGVLPQVVFEKALKAGRLPYNGTWLLGTYNPMEDYYGKVFRMKNIPFKTSYQFQFKVGDTVLVHHQDFLDSLGKYNHNQQLHCPDNAMPIWVFAVDSVLNRKN